jgi:hypothetical protein
MTGAFDMIEQLTLPANRCAIVARFASRWFVLTGRLADDVSTYDVSEPYETRALASAEALRVVRREYAAVNAGGAW